MYVDYSYKEHKRVVKEQCVLIVCSHPADRFCSVQQPIILQSQTPKHLESAQSGAPAVEYRHDVVTLVKNNG